MSASSKAATAYEDIRSCAGPLESKVWYHGELSRDAATDKLFKPGSLPRDGFFLVRKGSAGLVLSVLEKGAVKNYKISEQVRGNLSAFSIDDGPRFPTVANLIEFYRTAKKGALPIKLGAHCPNKDLSSPHFEFGRYGVAWLSTSGQKIDEEKMTAQVAVAEKTYRQELQVLEVQRPRVVTNKFAAAARAVLAAKRMEWKSRSKKIIESVRPEDMEPEGPENPQTKRFNRMNQTFRKSAAVETRLHLNWVNGKLVKAGFPELDNMKRSLRSGIVVINLIHLLTGRPKPRHSESPNSDIQMKDNWHCVMRYMEKVNIPTYDILAEELYNLDQRAMLKLFSILMKWDADQQEAAQSKVAATTEYF